MPRQIIRTFGLDKDTVAFAQRVKAGSGTTILPNNLIQLNKFVVGIKRMGIWNQMVCWPMRSTQNAGRGSTVYSLGGFGTFNGTMVNGPSWSTNGVTFGSNTQYIEYSPNFTVDFTRGGYSVHAVWSALGVPITSGEGGFGLFGSSDLSLRNIITTGVLGDTTWLPQSQNYSNNRYYNAVTNQPVVGNIGYGWNADTFILQRDGSDLAMGVTIASTPTNGSYTMRTTGRNNSTTSATSRVSYLIAFPPGIGMTAQRLNLIYNLSRQTLGNGLGLP
jgi:hypothetical protein